MTSRKMTIIVAIVVGVPVLLAGGALLMVRYLVTPEMIRKSVLPRVEQAVHRRIEMGDAKIRLFSGITVSGLKIFEKDGKGTFVSLGEARLHYQLLPLLSRRVVVDEIVIDTPEINILRNADGTFNFSDLRSREKTGTAEREEKTPLVFAVSSIIVRNGMVVYEDLKGISGSPFVFRARDIGIDIKDLTPEAPFPIEFTATLPGAELGFAGTVKRITDGPVLEGEFNIDASDLSKVAAGLPDGIRAKAGKLSPSGSLNATIKLSGPVKAPIGMVKGGEVRLEKIGVVAGGLSPVISGKMEIVDRTIVSRDLVVDLGKNSLKLLLRTSPLDKKPLSVVLNASSESLELDTLFPPKKGGGPKSPAAAGGGEKGPGPVKLPISMEGAVSVKNAGFKGLALSGISLRYRLKDNVLDIEEFKGSTAGGSFLDNARVNLGTPGFSYSTSLSLQGIQIEKAVAAFAPKAAGSIYGTLAMKADITGRGTSSAAVKQNLAGAGSFEVKNGKLTGSGFMSTLAGFLGSEELRVVRFSSFAGTYRIKEGNVHLDSALDGSDVRMQPKGRIGFDKSLDISLETRVAPRITGRVARGTVGSFLTDDQGWGVLPLKAVGTVGSPRFTLSGQAIGRKIGEKLGEVIRGKLGKEPEAGQKKEQPKLEDAIRGIFGK